MSACYGARQTQMEEFLINAHHKLLSLFHDDIFNGRDLRLKIHFTKNWVESIVLAG